MSHQSYGEIHFSYREMQQTYNEVLRQKERIEAFFKDRREVVLLGCGSSFWGALSAYRSFNLYTDKRATAIKAADIAMSPREFEHLFEDPVIIAPSRSGKSRELLDAVEIMRGYYPNLKVLSITQYPENELQKMSDLNLSIPWAKEISICQTRSFSCLYLASITIAGILGSPGLLDDIQSYLNAAPGYYAEAEAKVKRLVDTMESPEIVALGNGIQYGTTVEGAYIILEMAEHLVNYFQTLEYRHGPIVAAGPNTYAFIAATSAENILREDQMALEIKSHGGKVILCGRAAEDGRFDECFTLDSKYPEEIRGLFFVTMMQSVAYHLALKKGIDPDSPGELKQFISY